jgi:HSP20 family protein
MKMSMVRFDPFRDLAVLQDRMNRLFNEVPRSGRRDDEALATRGTWVPAVDIYEHEGTLVMKAELPDMRREDIDLSVENSTLTLRGERRFSEEVKEESVHRIERAYGSFSRAFTLPATVDAGRIAAEYKHGVLTIRLPFREEAKPRSIKVEVAT